MIKDKKKTIIYLIWAFAIAWILQVIASVAANEMGQMGLIVLI